MPNVLIVQGPLQKKFDQVSLEKSLMLEGLGKLQQIAINDVVGGFTETLNGESTYLFIRIVKVKKLQSVLRRQ